MKRFFLMTLLILSACAPSQNEEAELTWDNSQSESTTGITGGRRVRDGDERGNWVVLVRGTKGSFIFKSSGICTGAFITDNIILTAAHCLTEKGASYDVTYGSSPLNEDRKVLKIDKAVIHEQYKPTTVKLNAYDLALIRIKGKKPDKLKVLRLESEVVTETPQEMLVIGYGNTATGNRRTELRGVLHATPTIISKVTQTHLIGNQVNGVGICQGDSGGPLLRVSENGEPLIVGVTHAVFQYRGDSPSKNECHHHAAYVSVAGQLNWIMEQVELLGKP